MFDSFHKSLGCVVNWGHLYTANIGIYPQKRPLRVITLLLAQTGIFLLLLLWEQRMSLCRRVEREKGRAKVFY